MNFKIKKCFTTFLWWVGNKIEQEFFVLTFIYNVYTSKQRIGFLGACFFIGVLVASTIFPIGFLSDKFGRKWIYVGTLTLVGVSSFGFIIAKDLDQLYIYMFLFGLTFPGRFIVGMNYC